jgi:hypothetical protein
MGLRKFTNRAAAPLSAAITNVATAIPLAAGTGARFPALAAGESFMIVIQKGPLDTDQREYARVTARATDTLTAVRGQEGSTALAFDAGDIVARVATAGDMGSFVQKDGDALTAQLDEAPGVLVATAATVNIGAVPSNTIYLSGSVTITSLGPGTNGMRRRLHSNDGVTFTYGAALVLPGFTNLTLAGGQWIEFYHTGTGWNAISASATPSFPLADASSRNANTAWVQALLATGARALVSSLSVSTAAGALADSSASGYFRKVGRFVEADVTALIPNNGTGSGAYRIVLPWASARNTVLVGRENAISGYMLQGILGANSDILTVFKYDGTYPGASGAIFHLSGWYEATS